MISPLYLVFLVFQIYAQLTQNDMNLFLNLVNNLRASRGLPRACYNRKLIAAAQSHSNYQARARVMSHTGAGGSSVGQRISAAGFRWNFVAENVAYGQSDARAAFEAWKKSPGHYKNMVNPNSVMIGFGRAVSSDRRSYWTQTMAKGNGERCN
ncbi:hypothetical protein HDV02_004643 [Globomyces sp. JEL0801]|nr:hypothetical protein HDV02_004643 [Globomyces sp. JEL0801]